MLLLRRCACPIRRIFYPYRDAGVQDTVQVLSDPSFTPQNGTWLAAPVATLFGQAQNATAVLLQINVSPSLSPPHSGMQRTSPSSGNQDAGSTA